MSEDQRDRNTEATHNDEATDNDDVAAHAMDARDQRGIAPTRTTDNDDDQTAHARDAMDAMDQRDRAAAPDQRD